MHEWEHHVIDRLIHAILSHRKAVVATFLIAALVSAACIPFVKTNYDLADYLPPSAQSTTAVQIMSENFDQAIPNANVMVENVTIAQALEIKADISKIDGVEGVLWLDDVADITQPLEMLDPTFTDTYYHAGNDGAGTALFQVSVAEGSEKDAIAQLRALVDAPGRQGAVSGEAMDTAQMQLSMVDQVGKAVMIVVPTIVLLLILSTMSWIEPVLFLAAIGVSILINMGTNLIFPDVSFVTYSVSPILQLAVSLDYAIFLLHAFAAERRRTDDLELAMARAMRSSAATVATSATTTLFGFAALAFMQFQIGADLGLNLVKGIALSFITVMVFLPALTMIMVKLIDRTTHRRLMPSFERVGSVLGKLRVPTLLLICVLVIPAFLGQAHTAFTYQNNVADPNLRAGADTLAVQEEFGQQNAMVVLVEQGNPAAEAALAHDLGELDNVKSVMSFPTTVGTGIPSEFLDESITAQFYSGGWARIIAYLDTDVESDEAFATVETVSNAAARHFDTFYTAGQSANLYDMKNIVAVDNIVVSLMAVICIFLVVMITFRSLAIPVALLLTIESGIWINLSIPYFMGEHVNFIGYLVINTVQLGATIDYGILLTTHYLRWRKQVPAREAVHRALGETFPSLLVSAGILATAGFALYASSAIAAVSSLGMLLARGALISLALVTCLLPALLVYGDGIIRRLTWRPGFAPARKAPGDKDASLAPSRSATEPSGEPHER